MCAKIQDEDDLQSYSTKYLMLESGVSFPKITRIAGEVISPEIDLLYIYRTKDEQKLTGYEFKLLKSRRNSTNYRRIYEGIGQTILYFQYGIDVSYLLLGVSKNVPLDKQDSIYKMLYQLTNIMKHGLRCIGVKVWREEQPSIVGQTLKPEEAFPCHYSKAYQLSRENLLSGKFVYNKKFLERTK